MRGLCGEGAEPELGGACSGPSGGTTGSCTGTRSTVISAGPGAGPGWARLGSNGQSPWLRKPASPGCPNAVQPSVLGDCLGELSSLSNWKGPGDRRRHPAVSPQSWHVPQERRPQERSPSCWPMGQGQPQLPEGDPGRLRSLLSTPREGSHRPGTECFPAEELRAPSSGVCHRPARPAPGPPSTPLPNVPDLLPSHGPVVCPEEPSPGNQPRLPSTTVHWVGTTQTGAWPSPPPETGLEPHGPPARAPLSSYSGLEVLASDLGFLTNWPRQLLVLSLSFPICKRAALLASAKHMEVDANCTSDLWDREFGQSSGAGKTWLGGHQHAGSGQQAQEGPGQGSTCSVLTAQARRAPQPHSSPFLPHESKGRVWRRGGESGSGFSPKSLMVPGGQKSPRGAADVSWGSGHTGCPEGGWRARCAPNAPGPVTERDRPSGTPQPRRPQRSSQRRWGARPGTQTRSCPGSLRAEGEEETRAPRSGQSFPAVAPTRPPAWAGRRQARAAAEARAWKAVSPPSPRPPVPRQVPGSGQVSHCPAALETPRAC